MNIRDLKPGQFFLFDSDISVPYVRTARGYASLISEAQYVDELDAPIATTELWVVRRAMIQYEIGNQELEEIIERVLNAEPPAPVEAKPQTATHYIERKMYYFNCLRCSKKRCTTLVLTRAIRGYCRKCWNTPVPKKDDRQPVLFELPEEQPVLFEFSEGIIRR